MRRMEERGVRWAEMGGKRDWNMLVRSISWGGGRAGVPSGLGGWGVLKPFITSCG